MRKAGTRFFDEQRRILGNFVRQRSPGALLWAGAKYSFSQK